MTAVPTEPKTGGWSRWVVPALALAVFVVDRVIQDWLVAHVAPGATFLTAAAWLPAVVSAPVGGVLADRWSRPRWRCRWSSSS